MSKCSSCNQALPELRAVNVAPSGFSYHGKATATCCRAFGDDDGAALKALVESDSRLMLVPKSQYDVLSADAGEWPMSRDVVETLQRQNEELSAQVNAHHPEREALRKRNAELARKLDEVRRVAKL